MKSLSKYFLIATTHSILIIYGALLLSALYFFDFNRFTSVLSDKRIISAVWVSLSAASLATSVSLLIAIPSAYAMSRYMFRLKPIIDIFLELPMIVSPAALGALILIFFQTPVGNFVRNHIDIIYTFTGIILAQFISVLGMCVRMLKTVFDEIPNRYENIARTLGATHQQTFFKITLPLTRKGILSSGILTWAKAIGEFGATITVAGSIAMKTETLPTAIFMRISTADINGTIVLILILFSISIAMLIAARWLFRTNKI